jgi:hypothetical protein
MDLVTASQVRLLLAVELPSGDVRLPCEIIRLSNGRIVWCEFARLLDIQQAQYTIHALDEEPTGELPEWRAGDVRFFMVGRDKADLISAWQGYEVNRIRNGTNRVLRCLQEFGEAEYGQMRETDFA